MSGAAEVKRDHAAGGVVLDGHGNVALIKPAKRDEITLPKGHLDPGEDDRTAALREVQEETGLTCEVGDELGQTAYAFVSKRGTRVEKTVSYFLMRPTGGQIGNHDLEIERSWWSPLELAAGELTWLAEREMLARAVAAL